MNKINSGADYAKYVVGVIEEEERAVPPADRLPAALLKEWIVEIYKYADQTWADYVTGKREEFDFTEEEMNMLFDKAGLAYTSEILNGLVDKDLVKVEVDKKGDLLYGLTREGLDALNNENKQS